MNKLPIHKIEMPKINKSLDRGYGKIAVEIIRPWGGYQVGAVIKPPGIVRGWLIDTGRAVIYKPKPVAAKPEKPVRQKKVVKIDEAREQKTPAKADD